MVIGPPYDCWFTRGPSRCSSRVALRQANDLGPMLPGHVSHRDLFLLFFSLNLAAEKILCFSDLFASASRRRINNNRRGLKRAAAR